MPMPNDPSQTAGTPISSSPVVPIMDPTISPLLASSTRTSSRSVALIAESAKQCLETLGRMMQLSIEQTKKMAKDSIMLENLEQQARASGDRIHSLEQERRGEIDKLLELANDMGRVRKETEMRLDLEQQLEVLKTELTCAKEETERVRERYREALVSSTKSALQTSQLMEELEAAKQQAGKAERSALKESRRAQQVLEENTTLVKRCEQLERQLTQTRTTLPSSQTSAQKRTSSSTFRLRSVDDNARPISNKRSRTGADAKIGVKNHAKPTNFGSVFEGVEDDPQAEFDFIG